MPVSNCSEQVAYRSQWAFRREHTQKLKYTASYTTLIVAACPSMSIADKVNGKELVGIGSRKTSP